MTMFSEFFPTTPTPVLEHFSTALESIGGLYRDVTQQIEVVEGLQDTTAALESFFAANHDTDSNLYAPALEAITRRINLPTDLVAPALESVDGKDNLIVRLYKAIKAALLKMYNAVKSFFKGIKDWVVGLGRRASVVEKKFEKILKDKDAEILGLRTDIVTITLDNKKAQDALKAGRADFVNKMLTIGTDQIDLLLKVCEERDKELTLVQQSERNRRANLKQRNEAIVTGMTTVQAQAKHSMDAIELARVTQFMIETVMEEEAKFQQSIDIEIEKAKENNDRDRMMLLERLAKEHTKISTKEINTNAASAAELVSGAESVANSIKSK